MPRRESGEGETAAMNRRAFLVSGSTAVAGAAGAALLDAPSASARTRWVGDPSGPSVNGLVSEARGDTLVLKQYHLSLGELPAGARMPTGHTLAVRVPHDARLFRGRRVDLQDYRRGDKIIVYVRWEDSELVARGAEPLYTSFSGVVRSRRRSRLKVKDHTVLITEETEFEPTPAAPHATSLDDISKGDRIFVLCWFDVTSRGYVADKIGFTGT